VCCIDVNVQDFFTFRKHLYALDDGEFLLRSHRIDSLETLQYFVFHLFDASRHIANRLASDSGGSDVDFFNHLVDESPLWRDSESSQRRTLEYVDAEGNRRVINIDDDEDPDDVAHLGLTTSPSEHASDDAALRTMKPPPSTQLSAADELAGKLQSRVHSALRLGAAVMIASLVVYVRPWRAAVGAFGIWSPLTALLVMDRSMGSSVRKSVMRIQGTAMVCVCRVTARDRCPVRVATGCVLWIPVG
jgi:hypothetical protein